MKGLGALIFLAAAGVWKIISEGIVMLAALLLSGCAAAIPLATGAVSGGVSLYKSETKYGPTGAEFTLVKFESNHIVYSGTPPPK